MLCITSDACSAGDDHVAYCASDACRTSDAFSAFETCSATDSCSASDACCATLVSLLLSVGHLMH